MNKVVLGVAIVATVAIVGGYGWNQYQGYKVRHIPPKVTVQDLQQNKDSYARMAPFDVVKYVDTASSNLNTQSNPVKVFSDLKRVGYMSENCYEKAVKGNFWTPDYLKKSGVVDAKIVSINVLSDKPSVSDPYIEVVNTREIDQYDFGDGNKPSKVEQTVEWFLMKSDSGQWQITDFNTLSYKKL